MYPIAKLFIFVFPSAKPMDCFCVIINGVKLMLLLLILLFNAKKYCIAISYYFQMNFKNMYLVLTDLKKKKKTCRP